jgi:poly(ADP-ribose) glycohydrolase ARH3
MTTATDASDAAAGAVLGTFVGDALGMPFEGQPAAAIPARLEMEEARLGRGTYTDDTQMMIALRRIAGASCSGAGAVISGVRGCRSGD